MTTFGRLSDLVRNGLDLDDSKLFFHIFNDKGTEQYIIFLNTEDQLFNGVDAKKATLESIGGGYAASTIKRKRRKGQPTDRVTLRDTGDFYQTFTVEAFRDEFTIEANFMKSGYDIRDRWGLDLTGLTDESREKLIDFILPEVRNFVVSWLLK